MCMLDRPKHFHKSTKPYHERCMHENIPSICVLIKANCFADNEFYSESTCLALPSSRRGDGSHCPGDGPWSCNKLVHTCNRKIVSWCKHTCRLWYKLVNRCFQTLIGVSLQTAWSCGNILTRKQRAECQLQRLRERQDGLRARCFTPLCE